MTSKEIEAIVTDVEDDAFTFWTPGGDREAIHSEADKAIAKLLLAVCMPKYRERVAKIVEAYKAGSEDWYYA